MPHMLTPGSVTLADLERIYWTGAPIRLAPEAMAGIDRSAARIAEVAAGDAAVYGVNTGFGKLASIRIDRADVAALQRNLILSHCCGVGDPLGEDIVRLILSLKLLSLGRGASGVRRARAAQSHGWPSMRCRRPRVEHSNGRACHVPKPSP